MGKLNHCGRRLLRLVVSASLVGGSVAALSAIESASPAGAVPADCSLPMAVPPTGGGVTCDVPMGMTSIAVLAYGGSGGSDLTSGDNAPGGLGGAEFAVIGVTLHEELIINGGGGGAPTGPAGSDGPSGSINGGGGSAWEINNSITSGQGGGPSTVRTPSGSTFTDLVVAGGGGGSGSGGNSTGGTSTGGAGGAGGTAPRPGLAGQPLGGAAGQGGTGATSTTDGVGGVAAAGCANGTDGEPGGSLDDGGNGGGGCSFSRAGSGGGGGGGHRAAGGGGAGNVYGTVSSGGGGGGGGANFAMSSAHTVESATGLNNGAGMVYLTDPSTTEPPLFGAEVNGGINGAEACSCAQHQATSHPVDTATGNFWHTFDDLSIPGRGIPLDLSRTYNSDQASVPSAFGNGWSFTYGMSLALSASGDATVTQEDGSQVMFTANGSGGFTAPSRVQATLVANTGGSYTFTRKARQVFTFNSSGQLTSESDLNGYTTSLTYSGGLLTTVTDPASRTLIFTYNASNLIATATDTTASRTYTYGYSGSNLTSVTDPDGGVTTYGYDSSNQMTTMLDPNQHGAPSPVPLTNVYNAQGQVISQTDSMGRTTTFAYSGLNLSSMTSTTTITNPTGTSASPTTSVTVDTYAAQGTLTSETTGSTSLSPATTAYTYDPATLATASITDPNGHVTNYAYDTRGNLLSETTHPTPTTSDVTTYTYDTLNDVLTKTTPGTTALPGGETTTYTYDADGNLLTTSAPLVGSMPLQTQTTTDTYGAAPGDVTSVIDPDDKAWTYTYDTDGDLASATDPTSPVGNETTYSYSCTGGTSAGCFPNVGLRYSTVSARGNAAGATPANFTTSYAYDGLGDLTKETDPNGHVTAKTYDADGDLKTETDPNSNLTTYSYDLDNELTGVAQANSTNLSYTYDRAGNQITQTNGAGNTTTNAYADPALPTSLTSQTTPATTAAPSGETTTYAYDGAGNLTTVTNPAGQVTTYGYDGANEQTSTSYSDGVTHGVTYAYDADGERTSMTDVTGTTLYSYDSLGRQTSSTNGALNTVAHAYDLKGQTTSITYPGGTNSATYTYYDNGLMHTVTDWLGHTTTYTYDQDGDPTNEAYPNGTAAATTYDPADQVSAITDTNGATTYASFTYTRNNANQVHTETDTGVPGSNQTYSYNQLDQLTGTSSGTIGYDAANDPTALDSGINQSFNQANQLCSSATVADTSCASPPTGATAFTYNAQGERTTAVSPSGTTTTNSFNQAGELTATTPSVNSSSYTALNNPTRVCDTRAGNPDGLTGTANQCDNSTLTTAGQSRSVQLSGAGMPVPLTASAVVLNVTAIDSSSTGGTYLTVFPTGQSLPDTSNINVAPNATVNNQVTVAPGTNGSGAASIDIYDHQSNTLDVIVDVEGYYTTGTSGSSYVPITPKRVCDTRAGSGLPSPYNQCNVLGTSDQPIAANGTLSIQVAGTGFPKPVGVTAAVVDVTAIAPTAGTFLTAYALGATRPSTSSLNASAGSIVDKEVTVPLNTSSGKFVLWNYMGNTDVVVDVEGYFTGSTNSLFKPITSTRVCDTRPGNLSGLSGPEAQCNGASNVGTTIGSGATLAVQVAGLAGVPSSATAVVLNVTAVNESASGWMDIYPAPVSTPASTQLNFTTGAIVSNEVTVGVGTSDDIEIFNHNGTADAIVDVVGYYVAAPPLPAAGTYAYNGDGLRMSKTVAGTAEPFTWDTTTSVPQLVVDGTTDYVFGVNGLPLEQVSGTTTHYYDQDQLGSTRVITGGSGSVVATYTYGAYGSLTGSTGSTTNPFLYAGQYQDSESGLYYLQNRYYDPTTGQFISIDPLVAETGQPYGYANEDPANLVDPSGLKGSLPHSVSFPGIGYVLTISGSVEAGTEKCGVDVGVTSDGTVDVTSGNATAEVSSDPAANGLLSGHGLSVSSDGYVSYATTTARTVGSVTVSVSVTATMSPSKDPPDSGGDGALKTIVEVAGSVVTVVVVAATAIGSAIGAVCNGPFGGLCDAAP
jgi:RHS repeat-associated protein